MTAPASEAAVTLTIDGKPVAVPAGTSVWDACRAAGVPQPPVLCHKPGLRPVGVCRVCLVEVQGARVLAASCVRPAENGMVVKTETEKVRRVRRVITEMLMSRHPAPCERERQRAGACELEALARRDAARPRFPNEDRRAKDPSSPVIAVDHSACILCDRCIRACDDVQVNEVIGRHGKGHGARIGFDDDRPMGTSSCVSCGECAEACPTGALTHRIMAPQATPAIESKVKSVCPYCGVGCAIEYRVSHGQIAYVKGLEEGFANLGRLCVKGRYGYDYVNHDERLTSPLIRRADRPKREKGYADPASQFREATWDEALDLCARTFARIKAETGPRSLAGFGSAKASCEDNYLFQKLVRAVFGTNNVDHCTRLCHASSVAALMETIGSGSVSNPFNDVALADVCLVIGSNTTENHPVAATFIKQAAKSGRTTLIVADPRRPDLARQARWYVRFKPGTDVALLNGLMHVILRENLHNPKFVAERTEGFEALKAKVKEYPPEAASKITGVPAGTIEEVARAYARARNAMIFWGMGISQHTTGTDNARCLISLCMLCGQVGRPGTGLHPLRGQNNVQGASDVGLIPMVYTGYQSVKDPAVRGKFEKAWGVPLDPDPGLTVVEIMHAVLEKKIRAMYMMGENPFLSDPDQNKVRKALATMEFLAVQDIFLTETAEFADVVLPAAAFPEKTGVYINTNRQVQLARRAVPAPGQARDDWRVVADVSRRMGYPMEYASESAIWDEIARLTPPFAGISHARLESEALIWPVPTAESRGTPVIFDRDFPRGRGRFVPCDWAPPDELPDRRYPFVLNTGRLLEHWHTGTMTRRAKALDAIQPVAYAEMNPGDLKALRLKNRGRARVASRRGEIEIEVRASTSVSRGSVFIPFHFKEAAANVLTNPALDPIGKIPEFKFCAVSVTPVRAARRSRAKARAR
jgi:formate dehydrogenase major subunit